LPEEKERMGEKKTITDFIPPRRAPAEKRPSLTVITERDFGRQYYLDKGETVIGRDDDCDIRLQDARTSRKHTKIVGEPGRKSGPYFKAVDLDSTNGTYINDKRIKEAALGDGDRLHVGYTVFKYSVRDVEELEMEKKMYRMATTDALTGLFSREYFTQQLGDTFHRCERYQRPFSLIMADIDDFKAVNDTYGHPTGDVVLEGVGRIITDIIRHEDCGARYGGEEFMVLLPETPPENARYPAERLRKSLEGFRFQAEGKRFSVTVSVGIAGFPDHASTMDELIEKVDQALYEAKRAGKNTVRLFHADTQP
jgi:diguanylate cyclase (GGDEF)-like protein